jgi:hypothetical protein
VAEGASHRANVISMCDRLAYTPTPTSQSQTIPSGITGPSNSATDDCALIWPQNNIERHIIVAIIAVCNCIGTGCSCCDRWGVVSM